VSLLVSDYTFNYSYNLDYLLSEKDNFGADCTKFTPIRVDTSKTLGEVLPVFEAQRH
jgi:hypothetical protein